MFIVFFQLVLSVCTVSTFAPLKRVVLLMSADSCVQLLLYYLCCTVQHCTLHALLYPTACTVAPACCFSFWGTGSLRAAIHSPPFLSYSSRSRTGVFGLCSGDSYLAIYEDQRLHLLIPRPFLSLPQRECLAPSLLKASSRSSANAISPS